MKRTIKAADLYCGAGGTSTGLVMACQERDARVELAACNHWHRAVETHAANHPKAIHACDDVTTMDPRKVVPGGKLDLLVASPECTHHSVARGGKPVNDQSRASAWCILRWATALLIDRILIENVREWQSWGPIGSNGRPLKTRRGETFEAFIGGLKSLGYRVEWRVLNAADYGDPTTRERLFVQAVKGRRVIRWPEPTHARRTESGVSLFGNRRPWEQARERVIDWSVRGQSIFNRKRPLSENTLKRIEAGLRKFGGANAEPFLVLLRGTSPGQVPYTTRGVDGPLPTLTTGPNVGLCEPFIVPHRQFDRMDVDSVDLPLRTVTATNGGKNALVEPFMVPYYGTAEADSVDGPLRTVTTRDRMGLVEPTGARLDILFRMLQPHELAAAMSFPRDYKFAGNRGEVVKQIGNAVPVRVARSLCAAMLEDVLS